jgi:hypothetical protein
MADKCSAWGFTISTKTRLCDHGQVFWLVLQPTGRTFPRRSSNQTAPQWSSRGGRRHSQRRVRTGFTPASLLSPGQEHPDRSNFVWTYQQHAPLSNQGGSILKLRFGYLAGSTKSEARRSVCPLELQPGSHALNILNLPGSHIHYQPKYRALPLFQGRISCWKELAANRLISFAP